MGMKYNEKEKRWEWTGNARDLVSAVGNGDARMGFVVDLKSGAKIAMNINGTDDNEATEPFYIESPDGDNMYDASDRKDAVRMLNNIRDGRDADDYAPPPTKKSPRKKAHRDKSYPAAHSLRSMR